LDSGKAISVASLQESLSPLGCKTFSLNLIINKSQELWLTSPSKSKVLTTITLATSSSKWTTLPMSFTMKMILRQRKVSHLAEIGRDKWTASRTMTKEVNISLRMAPM